MGSSDKKLECSGVDDHDWEMESPSSPILKMGFGKLQKKSKRRVESLAALLGDQILEDDLKSLSYPTSELPEKKSRQKSQSKRMAFVDQKFREPVLDLAKDDAETLLLSTSQASPPTVKRREKRVVHEAPDKDDEWGATDVLTMLPDGPDTFLETEAKESTTRSNIYNLLEKMKPPSSKKADIDMSSDFGDYQPSFLSAPRRTPLAGRRRSPARGGSLPAATDRIETHLEPPVKTTYIKLSRKPESTDIDPQSEGTAEMSGQGLQSSTVNGDSENVKVEGGLFLSKTVSIPKNNARDEDSALDMASLEVSTDLPDLGRTLKQVLDFDKTPLRQDLSVSTACLDSTSRIDHVSRHSQRDSSVGPQPALEHGEKFKQLTLDNRKEKPHDNLKPYRPDLHHDSRDDLSRGSNIQGFQRSVEFQGPAHSKNDDEEWNSRQRAFYEMLLAERNALQLKLDMEREKFLIEKETFQARINDEGLRWQGEIQLLSFAKEKFEAERERLANEVKTLREENLQLKDEILRVENERLAFEKKICGTEHSQEDLLLNKVEEEKEAAQKLAIQLTSEVQLLKNSSLLAEEKMACLYKLHEQELQMMKSLHSQELEVKDKHLDMERKFWSDHKTTLVTVTQLLEKGDEWAVKVDELHSALLSERKLASSDKTVWLETMNETVDKAHAALHEWGDHCNGIKNQFDQLLAVPESGGREMKTMHLEERERLDKEHSRLKLLQEALQEERAQSLVDLSASRERLEEMRSQCFVEKESFLSNCMQELKNIAAEKEAIVNVKEQLLHAEAALEKQIMEHAVTMQAEASEAAKQRLELERAKEIAAEIVQEVEGARQELEQRRQAFEREIASVRDFGLQAQQKIESAVEIKQEAVQLKLEAEAVQQQNTREASEIERQRIQTAMAQKGLLELKRRHDEERMRIAMERQQLCSERKENGFSRGLRDPTASHGPVLSVFDSSNSQVLDLRAWDAMQKMNEARKAAVVPTRASHISSNSRTALGSGPWVVESVEASLCLQAQEDFLAEASKVLQHTTQSTCKLLTKT